MGAKLLFRRRKKPKLGLKLFVLCNLTESYLKVEQGVKITLIMETSLTGAFRPETRVTLMASLSLNSRITEFADLGEEVFQARVINSFSFLLRDFKVQSN